MRPSVRTGGNGFVMDFFSLRKTTACQAAPAMTRRRPSSGAAVNPKRGPFSAEPLNIYSDEVAVVLEFLAMDNFSADASFILQGSELHYFVGLPRTAGNYPGAVDADVIRTG